MEFNQNPSKHRKTTQDSNWNNMLQIYTKHREDNGDRPVSRKINSKLYAWVARQRRLETQGDLREDRKERLEAVGFDFVKKLIPWTDMFDRLKVYKEAHGDCRVPQKYSDDSQLGTWVHTQRNNKDQLGEEERRKLNSIGFSWSVARSWDSMFDRVKRYKEINGNCAVNRSSDEQLWRWTYRQQKRNDGLTSGQHALLESIGFEWGGVRQHKKNENASQEEEVAMELDEASTEGAVPVNLGEESPPSEVERTHATGNVKQGEEIGVLDGPHYPVAVVKQEDDSTMEHDMAASNEEELDVLEEPHYPVVAVKQEDNSSVEHDMAASNEEELDALEEPHYPVVAVNRKTTLRWSMLR